MGIKREPKKTHLKGAFQNPADVLKTFLNCEKTNSEKTNFF